MINELKDLYAKQQEVDNAEAGYVDLIGKRAEHTNSIGKLHSVKVNTKVAYQKYTGGNIYQFDASFDEALAKVVRKNFTQLSEEALLLMQADVDARHKALREGLQEALNDIDSMEC